MASDWFDMGKQLEKPPKTSGQQHILVMVVLESSLVLQVLVQCVLI
jgi:hypothetical protein